MLDTIKKIEERLTRRWRGGVGPEAVFTEDSTGWYAIFESCPASIYVGSTAPGLKAGDRVRLTLERV
jgi:hypothetical protein